MPSRSPQKRRIVVLGGGMAALSAIFELTNAPDWQEHYDITLYQMGWRLGGKGASSRNLHADGRIEEHGLHLFFGFYENACRLLHDCYVELRRPPGAPLATFEDAFKPQHHTTLMEPVGGRWLRWQVRFPEMPGRPGDGTGLPTLLGYVERLLRFVEHVLEEAGILARDHAHHLLDGLSGNVDDLERAVETAMARLGSVDDLHGHLVSFLRFRIGDTPLGDPTLLFSHAAQALAQALQAGSTPRRVPRLRLMSWLLGSFREALGRRLDGSDELRRLFILGDLAVSAALGMVRDLVLPGRDFRSLDHLDFRDWLMSHGAARSTAHSAVTATLYGLAFAEQHDIAAGTMLYDMLRLCFTYKGGIMWKMQAGMGETVFAPLYIVLRRRGVRFRFFHRVDRLSLSADQRRVARIEMGRQATVRGGAEYAPLVEIAGLPCWPGHADCYAQLEEEQRLLAHGSPNLEDWWSDWPDVERVTLEEGRDFDAVILGISVAALPEICAPLLAANQRFARMVEAVTTIQTQAVQLWFDRSLADLGWDPPPPIVGNFALPFDVWADMSHLLALEAWTPPLPRQLAFLCSGLEDDEPMPPRSDRGYPVRQRSRVHRNARDWLERHAGRLWPGIARAGGGVDWAALHAPAGQTGPARLDAQYWWATVSPSERYVLTEPGTTQYRLRADDSGFDNLYLAGDYTSTSINGGCIEAAAISGLHVSHALCGRPAAIIGEEDAKPPSAAAAPVGAGASLTAPGGASNGLPPYTERVGEIVLRHPIALDDTTMYAFFLPADLDVLEELVERTFPQASRGHVHYRPLLPMVVAVCAEMRHSQSQDPEQGRWGWSTERDFGFWVPLVGGPVQNGAVADRVCWLLPYVWVDNFSAIAVGRESFGFPKQAGRFGMPSAPGMPGQFTVDGLRIPRFDHDDQAEVGRIYAIRPFNQAPRGLLPGGWTTPLDVASGLLAEAGLRALLSLDLPGAHAPALVSQLLLDLVTRSVRLVFVKQFRDIHDPRNACYQAVTEAPSRLRRFHAAGLLGPHVVDIVDLASHPIVRDLGLPGKFVVAPLGVWTRFDFVLDEGEVLWAAT